LEKNERMKKKGGLRSRATGEKGRSSPEGRTIEKEALKKRGPLNFWEQHHPVRKKKKKTGSLMVGRAMVGCRGTFSLKHWGKGIWKYTKQLNRKKDKKDGAIHYGG